jgi:hypothetical protein
MIDFAHIKYGIVLALVAILFGGFLGLSFGCCEDSIKGALKSSSDAVLQDKYQGDQKKADKVTKKAWVYLKRAHLHSQTMGVIAIAFSLLVAWLNFSPRMQMGISLLSGFGSLGYGVFWLFSAWLAPGMGSTGAAKEAVGLIAQASGGSFFVAGLALFVLLILKMFAPKRCESSSN